MKRDMVSINRTVIGYPEQLETALRTAYEAGRLVTWGKPRPVAPGDRRMRIDVELLEEREVTWPVRVQRPARNWRPYLLAAVVVGVLAVVAAVVWLVVTYIAYIVAGAVGLLVLAALVAPKCKGLHCGGCRG